MCGIAGGVFFNGRFGRDEIARVGQRMLAAIRHRGPDGEGLWIPDHAGADRSPVPLLVHSRLAIIDTSSAGAQPMTGTGLSQHLTFNGEIYNFKRVRAALEAQGHRFDSQSDSEVILRGFAARGPAILDALRGMFALGIWNPADRTLFLARDRFGIKPLYVASGDGWFLFASEVRALLASGLVPPILDLHGLWHYLTYQAVPGPTTMVAGIRMLDPGSTMVVDEHGRAQQTVYWDLAEAARSVGPIARADCLDRVRTLLAESVACHLVSDVPVGAFLSGGIDSSAVVALMREAGHTPRTFSVGFAEARFDESLHAEEVARLVGSEHLTLRLDEATLLDQLPAALGAMDQPSGDGINTYVVSRAVRETGLVVALSGLGGDELFAGYPSFDRLPALASAGAVWGLAPGALRSLAGRAARGLGGGSVAGEKVAAALASDGSLAALYPLMRQLLSRDQRLQLVAPQWRSCLGAIPDPYVERLREGLARMNGAGWLSKVSYAETRTYMHDVLLRDADQMSMAHALEVRVPLVDHEVAAFVLGLEDRHKAPGDTPKRLLVEAMGASLPAQIVHRPKQGFTLPFEPWMRGQLRGFCEHHLGPDGLSGRGLVEPGQIRHLWASFLAGGSNVTWSRLWMLVALDHWLEQHQVAAPDG